MKFIRYLLVSLFLMLPAAFASADTLIKPPGKDTWEMHVMGNGPVIASVLESVKLIIAPEDGGSGFRTLVLFIALLGFCILAVQAGFNPGANLFKMFGYLFVVWVVTLTTTQLKANIIVIDPVTRTNTFVAKVPAVVALPAAVVSGIGHYLTTQIQQAYSKPGQDLSLTGAGFDIFGKVQSDLDQYTVAQPELRQSMAAYIGDCAVPAIAKQRLTASELYTSKDLMATLEKAQSGTTLTRYYVARPTAAAVSTTFGVQSDIISCKDAYPKLVADMEEHAKQMMDAGTKEWAKSGVMVPFEGVLQTFMEKANAGIGAGGGSYGRPTGMITQKALINTMGGDFRQAAVQTGNNELLMGVQVSQAEQSQKSGWVTSAAIFKNMMGYVYTTLQAFIYAITPIVVIALMVPGLGKKIFVNYGQILVWLTLWEPMLSIVNYLVTLFRMEGLANATAASGGITMLNTWATSEAANNMVIASSFLGTMVPVLAWGLVTGAMAFNDFISQGIGSSFAMSAGAAAATGSVGLNSMSMNTLNANKFDNAHKATVGNQSVMAHEAPGALTVSADRGGLMESRNGSAISAQGQLSQANSKSETATDTITNQTTAGTTHNAGQNNSKSMENSSKVDSSLVNENGVTNQSGTNASKGNSTGHDVAQSAAQKAVDSAGTSETRNVASQVGASVGGDVKPNKKGGKPGAGAAGGAAGGGNVVDTNASAGIKGSVTNTQSTQNNAGRNFSSENGVTTTDKAGNSTSISDTAGVTNTEGTRGSLTRSNGSSASNSTSESGGKQVSVGEQTTAAQAIAAQNAHTATNQQSFSASSDQTREDINRGLRATDSAGQDNPSLALSAYNTRARSEEISSAASGELATRLERLDGAGAPVSHAMPSAGGAVNTDLIEAARAETGAAVEARDLGAKGMGAMVNNGLESNMTNASRMFGDMNGLTHAYGGGFSTTSGGADGKMYALGGVAAAGALTSLANTAMLGRGAMGASGAGGAGGGAATGGRLLAAASAPVAVGAAVAAGSFAVGYYGGQAVSDYVGQEKVQEFMSPLNNAIDSATSTFQSARSNLPAWAK